MNLFHATIKALLTFTFLCFLSFQSYGQNYQMVFADEFDGSEVDTTNWTFLIGDGTEFGIPGWGNNELQWYLKENTTLANGLMTITAKEEMVGGYNYTSSRLVTQNKQDFKYGRFEMRAKMPIGQGMWPAYWLLFTQPGAYGGWAASGEIDIMEYIGSEPEEVFGTIHFGQPFPGNVFSEREYILPSGDFHEDFHVFAIEWEPGEIRWFVDSINYATQNMWFSNGGPYPAPFDQDFHLLLNLAVGGNLPGPPDATTVFPQEYVIDYVRVYQDLDLPTVVLDNPTDGTTFNVGDDVAISATPSATNGVAKVEFFQGDIKLGEATADPYSITINDVAEGTYRIRAVVTDNNGKFNYSDFAEITVGAGGQGPYAMAPQTLPGIIEMENYDVGGNGVAYQDNDPDLNQGSKSSQNRYRNDEGVDLEPTTDEGGGLNAGFIGNGEWLEYTVYIEETASYDITARVASDGASGSFLLEFDGVDKTGPISFGNTGGSQSWIDVTKESVTLDSGKQVVRVQMLANGFNLNNITIAPADPSSGEKVTFDDMEHGDPSNNGWFTFDGDGGGGIDANFDDVPPRNGGSASLQTGWGSGGNPGFFGGFGRTNPVDISQTTYFNMWVNPAGNQEYLLEINLQDDDNGDGAATPDGSDDEFQYNLTVGPESGDAEVIAGGGWQLVSIPLDDFFDDNSFFNGGNGVLDGMDTASGGNGQLINVILAVIGVSGSDVNFVTDFWSFTKGPLGPEIEVTPEGHSFREISVGSSGGFSFDLQNLGCTDLEISAVSLIGGDSADFSIIFGNAPLTVGPGGSTPILVSFAPSSLGEKNTLLVIESNDADEPSTVLPLSGTGVEPPDILKVVFDDMEHGDPFNNGYFTFNGLSGVTLESTFMDLPPQNSGSFSLSASLSSGGQPGFFGGFGREFPIDLSEMTHFNFWINPDAGQDYLIEIQLQDDDNGDDDIPFPPENDDDEFQYNFTVSADGDAISGGGWQLISLPLNIFFDDNSLHPGGDGILNPIDTANGGNGRLINLIFGLISNSGADITFRTDFWCFSKGPLGAPEPDIAVSPLNANFGFVFPGDSSSQTIQVVNNGGAPLEVSALNIVGEGVNNYSIVAGDAPFSVGIGESADIVVNFKPNTFGPISATLEIESNDPDQSVVTVGLSGEGSEVNKVLFDDMEHGDPFGNGWFTFDGNGGGGLDANSTDLPPSNGGAFSLQTGWGSGGNPGFFGGFGRTNPVDLSGMDHFNMWINPDADQDYLLEINLQDDDNGDNAFPFPAPDDDEFQYNFMVSAEGPDAISGGGWQLISIPFDDFFDDNSIHGGNGILDPIAVENSGNGQLINVVIAVISNSGADVTFRTDFWCFSEGPLSEDPVTGIDQLMVSKNSLSIYPNPTDGKVSINLIDAVAPQLEHVYLYNSTGQLVLDYAIETDTQDVLDLTGFEDGMYLLRVEGKERVYTGRVLLQR